MRIVLSNASYSRGGVHLITELLAAGFQQRGHDVLVLCRAGSPLEERLTGKFELAPVARGMDFSPWAIARIAATLRRFRPHIVFALMEKDLRLTGPAARMLGIPVIARRANDRGIDGGPYGRLVYGILTSHHIANSHATRATLLRSAPWLAAERVTVIHNGVDVDAIAHAPPAAVPLPADSITIGFIAARLQTRKGVLDLLDAWPLVANAEPRAQLLIAGRGHLEDALEKTSSRLDRITFLGYRTDVAALLQRCDIVAVPSHWEGFGLIAAEAMAAGKPVIISNTSSLPEIVRDGQEGLWVPPHDPQALANAILRLVRDPELRRKLGERGRERARACFTHERMVNEYEKIALAFARQSD